MNKNGMYLAGAGVGLIVIDSVTSGSLFGTTGVLTGINTTLTSKVKLGISGLLIVAGIALIVYSKVK